MMAFLNPLLLFGTLGVAVPIIVHLINRFRPRPIEWGAMTLLRKAMVSRSRQVKLEDLLLLLLRCMAILLLALAMARPTLTWSGGRLAGGAQVAAVIGLDASMSMGHRPGVQSRLDQGIERVREIASTLDHGSPLVLVLLGERPLVLHQGRYDAQQLDAMLKEVEPTPQRLNLEASLDALAEELERLEGGVREVYLVTDAQAVHFAEVSATAQTRLAELREQAGVMLVTVGDERHENTAIEGLRFVGGALRVDELARFEATVRNTGAQPLFNVVAHLYDDQTPIGLDTLDELPAGGQAEVSFLVRLDRAGLHRLSARLETDDLITDNACHAVFAVRERVQVLVVSGRSMPRWSDDAGGFVVRALQPRDNRLGMNSLQVRRIDWLEISPAALDEYDLVVLADVPDLSESVIRSLYRLVTRGGGLVIIAGQQVEPALFNARMASEAAPLAPARLLERPEASADLNREGGIGIRLVQPTHPLVRPLASLPSDLLDEVRILQHHAIEPMPNATVLLSLDDTSRTPLLVEQRVGLGRTLLMASAADRRGGDLVIHPAWPILWHQWISVLTQPMTKSHVVAQPLLIALDSAEEIEWVRFEGPEDQLVALTPRRADQQWLVELAAPSHPGFYELYAGADRGDDGQRLLVVAAVNVDARESDVRCLQPSALAESLTPWGDAIADPSDLLVDRITRQRVGRELWWPLLLLALLVLAVESILARQFTRRMSGSPGEKAPSRPWAATRWRGGRQSPPATKVAA
jgi:hypothetical protein